jgi:hypothetical protein
VSRPLADLIGARITEEGTWLARYGGMYFYRATKPTRYRKTDVTGPRVIVIAQGKKVAKFAGGELVYSEDNLLVLTGETTFEGIITEASPERPHLGMCMEIPPDLVARTLLALADGGAAPAPSAPRSTPALPAFVSPLTEPIVSTVVRLIRAIDDPLERKVVAPLVMDELVPPIPH